MLKKISIIVIILILLEFLLQSVGYVFTFCQRSENKKRLLVSKDTDIKIVCLGDSNTFGSESSYGNSYPEQLERLLNREIKNHRFVVYNLGIIGQNSTQVNSNLEKNILEYNPDYIIVLIGVNNRWNVSGRDCEISDDLHIKPRNKILTIANNLRLVKFIRLSAYNIRYRLFLNSAFFVRKGGTSALNNKNKNSPANKTLQEEICKIQSDIEKNNIYEALIKTKEFSEKYFNDAAIHALLGRIYYLQYNYKEGINEYDKALALEPNNVSFLHGKALCCRESGNVKESLNLYGVMAKLEPQDTQLKMDFRHTFLNFKHKWALSDREQKTMDYWLRQDLSVIIKISLRYNKKPILLTYPTQNWQDEIRKQVSQVFNVPLVDIYYTFNRLNNVSEYLGKTGGHPNDKGYYIMAQEVFDLIYKEFN